MWTQEVKPGLWYVYKKVNRRNVYVGKAKGGVFTPAEGISAAKEIGARRLLGRTRGFSDNRLDYKNRANRVESGQYRVNGVMVNTRTGERTSQDKYRGRFEQKEEQRVADLNRAMKKTPGRFHQLKADGRTYTRDRKTKRMYRTDSQVGPWLDVTEDVNFGDIAIRRKRRREREIEDKKERKRERLYEKEQAAEQARLSRRIRTQRDRYLRTPNPDIVYDRNQQQYYERDENIGWHSQTTVRARRHMMEYHESRNSRVRARNIRELNSRERSFFNRQQTAIRRERRHEAHREEEVVTLVGARAKAYKKTLLEYKKKGIDVVMPQQEFATAKKEKEFKRKIKAMSPDTMVRSYTMTGITGIRDRSTAKKFDDKGEPILSSCALVPKSHYHTSVRTDFDSDTISVSMSNPMWNCTREFRKERKGWSVYHASFFINNDFQGQGIAKNMFKKWYGLYEKMGVTKVTVSAAGSQGWKQWPKFGFDFAEKENINQRLKQNWIREGTFPAEKITQLLKLPAYKLRRAITDKEFITGIGESHGWGGAIDLTNKDQRKYAYTYVGYKPERKKREKTQSTRAGSKKRAKA